jgi:hypothetical protein
MSECMLAGRPGREGTASPLADARAADRAATRSTVGPLVSRSGQESGLVCGLDGAMEVRSID